MVSKQHTLLALLAAQSKLQSLQYHSSTTNSVPAPFQTPSLHYHSSTTDPVRAPFQTPHYFITAARRTRSVLRARLPGSTGGGGDGYPPVRPHAGAVATATPIGMPIKGCIYLVSHDATKGHNEALSPLCYITTRGPYAEISANFTLN